MNLKIAQFTGKFVYDQLFSYLSFFVKSKPKTADETEYEKEVTQISSPKQFKRTCVNDFCYLLLLNGAEQNKQKNQEYIKELQKLSTKIAPSDNLAHVDAVCHSQLLATL